jgi:type IV secretion system protein VirB3
MRDTIFKGATRPPMMLGVPIIPFILVVGAALILAMWALLALGFVASFLILMTGFGAVLMMREISKQDDQRLNQVLMRWRETPRRRNAQHWNAHSMSPIDFDRRRT